jgi:transcriptional regulator with XRE-family HTH domain
MDLTQAVAAVLRSERALQQVTYRELADGSGISQRAIYRMLSGQVKIVLGDLDKVAGVLGFKPWEVIQRAEEVQRRPGGRRS